MGDVHGVDFTNKVELWRLPPKPLSYTWMCNYCFTPYRYVEGAKNTERMIIELSNDWDISLCSACIEKAYMIIKGEGDV